MAFTMGLNVHNFISTLSKDCSRCKNWACSEYLQHNLPLQAKLNGLWSLEDRPLTLNRPNIEGKLGPSSTVNSISNTIAVGRAVDVANSAIRVSRDEWTSVYQSMLDFIGLI